MASATPRFLLIEGSDFVDFPLGGQLSVARSLIGAFGPDLALVGWARDGEEIGRWTTRNIGGSRILYFPFACPSRTREKPLIPHRATTYLHLRRFCRPIRTLGCTAAFMLAPETLLATSRWGFSSICFNLSGVSPVLSGRYRWSTFFERVLEERYISALQNADILLASADKQAIQDFASRANGRLTATNILQWPTRVDTTIFHPADRVASRIFLDLPQDAVIFVCCGRVSEEKGWRLLVNSFAEFQHTTPFSYLVFVGSGEDTLELKRVAARIGVADRVIVTGTRSAPEVSTYMNAANTVLVGSYVEGWSVAMVEALACGRPIVSTEVSGATDMIVEGDNGYIVRERSAEVFATAMRRALALGDCSDISRIWSERLSLSRLRSDLEAVWPAIR